MTKTITSAKSTRAAAGHGADRVAESQGAAPAAATRLCPTRAQGPTPLFQHTLTVSQCQSKQRGLYHKCFTCVHSNGR